MLLPPPHATRNRTPATASVSKKQLISFLRWTAEIPAVLSNIAGSSSQMANIGTDCRRTAGATSDPVDVGAVVLMVNVDF